VGENDTSAGWQRLGATASAGLIYCSRVHLSCIVAVFPIAVAVACGAARPERYVEPTQQLDAVDLESTEVQPSYSRSELERVLAEERRALTEASAVLASLMEQPGNTVEIALRQADLGVQQRYIDSLESCRARGQWCPPRLGLTWTIREGDLEVPVSLDAELRFDRDSWRTLASELWARGCDCRSMTCVDAMTQTINALETRPTPELQGEAQSSAAITAARSCLWRLRGKASRRGQTAGLDAR
jgi:hypothetical protein